MRAAILTGLPSAYAAVLRVGIFIVGFFFFFFFHASL